MTYIAETYNNLNSFKTDLENALAANGYILVDTVALTGYSCRVWKNPAANNTRIGKDWFLLLAFQNVAAGQGGKLNIQVAERYDVATHTVGGVRYVPIRSNQQVGYPYFNGDHELMKPLDSTTARASMTNSLLPGPLITNEPPIGFWLSVTPEKVSYIMSSAPEYVFYFGGYEMNPDLLAELGPGRAFPLVAGGLSGNSPSNNTTGAALQGPAWGTPAPGNATSSTFFTAFGGTRALGWLGTTLFDTPETAAWQANSSSLDPQNLMYASGQLFGAGFSAYTLAMDQSTLRSVKGIPVAPAPRSQLREKSARIQIISLYSGGASNSLTSGAPVLSTPPLCAGRLPEIAFAAASSSVARGDQLTVSGDATPWILTSPNLNAFLAMRME